jgi:hypothetical protein
MDPYVHHILSLICEIIEPYLIRDVASIIVEMVYKRSLGNDVGNKNLR